MTKEYIVNVKIDDKKAPEDVVDNLDDIIEDTLGEGFEIINFANRRDYLEIKSIEHD